MYVTILKFHDLYYNSILQFQINNVPPDSHVTLQRTYRDTNNFYNLGLDRSSYNTSESKRLH